jgi:hypothetical protein
MSMVSKSGTNRFHGEGYEFLRNSALNAAQWGVPTKSPDKENEFGGDIGGPVKIPGLWSAKRKTFFFYLYERWTPRGGVEAPILSYPTMQERAGNFSDWKDSSGNLVPVYDPATTQVNPNFNAANPVSATNEPFLRNQFMGCSGNQPNVICATDPRLTGSLANAWFKLMPPPNLPGIVNNYEGNAVPFGAGGSSGIDHRTSQMARIDHYEGEKDHIALNMMYGYVGSNNETPEPTALAVEFVGANVHPYYNTQLNYDHTFTPTLLNTLNLGWNWHVSASVPADASYVNQLPQIAGVQNHLYPPVLNFQNFNSIGLNSAATGDLEGSNVVNDMLTWVRGRHTLRFGGEFRALDGAATSQNNGSGTFNWAKINTGLSGINSGSDIASWILGQVNNANLLWTALPAQESRQKYYDLFASDTWKVRRKLTVNYGLRWDVSPPISEKFNRTNFFDPFGANPGAGNLPGRLAFAGSSWQAASYGRVAPEQTSYTSFAPRLGIAYAWSDKTAVRAGYGIFYSYAQYPGWNAGIQQDGFNEPVSFSSSNGGLTAPFLLSQGITDNFTLPPFIQSTADNGEYGPLYRVVGKYHLPTAQQWNLTIEHQFTPNFYINAAYIANRGTHLISFMDPLNALNPSLLSMGSQLNDIFASGQTSLDGVKSPYAGWPDQMQGCAPSVAQALVRFPQYCEPLIATNENGGGSNYQSFQLKAEKRVAHSTWMLLSYTVSKNLTNAETGQGQYAWGNMTGAISPYQLRRNYGTAAFDVPQNLSLAFLYQLPFGRGGRWLNHGGVIDKVVGGWNFTSIIKATSGTPFIFRSSACNIPAQFVMQCIPGILPGAKPFLQSPGSFNPGPTETASLFNSAAFENPSVFNFYAGKGAPVSNLRGPGFHNQDLTFMKETGITEKLRMQFRAEFFNIWNWHQFTTSGWNYGLNGTPTAFITDVSSPSFGEWNGAVTRPRNVQFAAKLIF